jgi:hypothetical protein
MIGSRAQVFHGTADRTAGGLTKNEGKKHLTSVFKPKKSGFKLQPKEGTKDYKKKMKKMA